MLEAAKTAHNVLVSELEKSKNDLSEARDSLQAANGKSMPISYRLTEFTTS